MCQLVCTVCECVRAPIIVCVCECTYMCLSVCMLVRVLIVDVCDYVKVCDCVCWYARMHVCVCACRKSMTIPRIVGVRMLTLH